MVGVEISVAFAMQRRTSLAVHHIVDYEEVSTVLQFENYESSALSAVWIS